MWVYDLKISPSGEYEKHKARIVLCGHKGFMVKGVHYTDTFAAAPDVTVSTLVRAEYLVRSQAVHRCRESPLRRR